jgi:hypothetical protein
MEGAPAAKRLGIKAGARVLLLDPPVGFVRTLEPLPDGASIALKPVSQMDLVMVFSSSRAALGEMFARARHVLAPRGAIWVAWPRKSSGFFTDLSEELVRSVGLAAGMTDDKIISIDEIWAALRFVDKTRDRLPLPKSSQISLPEA